MMAWRQGWRSVGPCLAFLLVLMLWLVPAPAGAQPVDPSGSVPGGTLGNISDAEIWRAVRRGVSGTVSIPDKKAATLVQSEGDNLRAFRNGPMAVIGGWSLLGIVVLLAAFFAIRGRIRVEGGFSGRTVRRFNALERFAHWLTAGSFIVLALSGLNMLYGKYVLIGLFGRESFVEHVQPGFAALTLYGKYAHNYLGFAFIAGVLLMLVIWVRPNLPNRHDLKWFALGGGLLVKGVHPPAKKFNAGQKLIFWIVVIGGLSLGASGLSLLFPFELPMFAKTFAALNVLGFDLPTVLTPLQETQLALIWHGILALAMIIVILAHIYIGTLGMVGAIAAVTTGQVDENWAREHHALWLEEEGEKIRQPDAAD